MLLLAGLIMGGVFLGTAACNAAPLGAPSPFQVRVVDKVPLVHIGFDAFQPVRIEREYGRAVMKLAGAPTSSNARKVRALFANLPSNSFNRLHFSGTQWLADRIADPDSADRLGRDSHFARSYFNNYTTGTNALMRESIRRGYWMDPIADTNVLHKILRNKQVNEFMSVYSPSRFTASLIETITDAADIHPGDRVADIGAGPGHMTFAFAKKTGINGRVYAVDSQELNRDFLRASLDFLQITNISQITARNDSIAMTGQVDVAVMNMVYPGLYCGSSEQVKHNFILSIRNALTSNGRLIVLDNARPCNQSPALYYSYIDAGLVIAQLSAYGFHLVRQVSVPGDLYMLIFENSTNGARSVSTLAGTVNITCGPPDVLTIRSRHNLLRLFGELQEKSIARTSMDVAAGKKLIRAIETGDKRTAEEAVALYRNVVATSPVGSEHSALLWFAEYLCANQTLRSEMTSNRFTLEYFNHFAADNFTNLRMALRSFYPDDTDPISGNMSATLLDDILFFNPRRELWEQTSRIIDFLHLKPGDSIVDVGSGTGYYSFKFADRVGTNGVVYATEINVGHLAYIDKLCSEFGISNIKTVPVHGDAIGVAGPVDTVFLCSLFHAVYGFGTSDTIRDLITSIDRALKPDGRLVIVDNAIVDDDVIPYHGPCIAKELVIAHLAKFGFTVDQIKQFTPQRYILVFKRSPSTTPSKITGI